jgi:Fe-S cluster assembly ATP-binding protein
MLTINQLHATITETETPIIKGLDLTLEPGKIHAIMGPNGSGKSTLSKLIAGDEQYTVTSGDIQLNGQSILEWDATQRALMGIFLAFQYPIEIPGVPNDEFLRMAYNAKQKHQGLEPMDPLVFQDHLQNVCQQLSIPESFLERELNVGFSGGEKKRNELLQLAVLKPAVAILDETDSGLDIDALKHVATGIRSLRQPTNTFLLITHYQRLLTYVEPDYVHIMMDGRIVETGDKSLAMALDKSGYDGFVSAR